MGCRPCCVCSRVARVAFLALLVALVPAAYLTFEYYLKPWGRDRLADYAAATRAYYAALNASAPDLSGASLLDGVACIKCPGVNALYPVTERSHPTYSSFQLWLSNNGAWFTSMLLVIGVAVGGGGSLLVALLNALYGAGSSASGASSPTSSTAQNGCGVFEMVLMLSQAQFVTLLGALQLQGVPRFFLEFARKLAWANLQIFPRETSYEPAIAGASRRLATASAATGVERYALLIGVEPAHVFYYTCVALAIVLGGILVVYLALRLLLGLRRKDVAASLDHRVIWVYLQLLVLAQYVVAMTACFQIYDTLSASDRNTGDLFLAIVVVAAVCIGVLAFGIVKVARHRDEISTHGTAEHDESKPFHVRYAVFYQDYTLENVYFFVAKMLLDTASGAVVGTIQDANLQLALLVALHATFLGLLIWRQPFLVPLFYYVSVLAGFLRLVLLLLSLVQTKSDVFPQDVRDFAAALVIALNAVLLLCLLVRQVYVLCVAIFKWASRPKQSPLVDEEMGIPLQDMADKSTHVSVMADKPLDSVTSATSTMRSSTLMNSSKSRRQLDPAASPIPDSTLFSSQPYHELTSDEPPRGKSERQRQRHSMATAHTSSSSAATARPSAKHGGRRSLYSQRNRRRKEFAPVADDELPDWAKV